MCKYCLEGNMLFAIEYELGFCKKEEAMSVLDEKYKEFVCEEKFMLDLDDNLGTVIDACILQEIDNVDRAFWLARNMRYSHKSADIMFCKALEMCIVCQNCDILDMLADDIGYEEYMSRVNKIVRAGFAVPHGVRLLPDIFMNGEAIRVARNILQSYIEHPYIEDEHGYGNYFDEFISVYASLCVMIKNNICDDIIESIALNGDRINSFCGFDLWIERIAFVHAIKSNGVQFVADNYSKLRYEVVHYSILKYKYGYEEINELKKIISKKNNGYYTTTKDTLRLIGALLDYMTAKKDRDVVHMSCPNCSSPQTDIDGFDDRCIN